MARPVVWASLMCQACGAIVRVKPCTLTKGQRFCSIACRNIVHPPPTQDGNQHASRGDEAGRMAMHYRARKATQGRPSCERCGQPAQLTHHKDENPRNNDLSNLERLCRRCHITHHRPQLEAAKRKEQAS